MLTIRDVDLDGCARRGRGRRTRVVCTLGDAAAVERATMRLKRGKRTIKRATVSPNAADKITLRIRRKLRKGRYVLTIRVIDSSGARKTLTFRFRVR